MPTILETAIEAASRDLERKAVRELVRAAKRTDLDDPDSIKSFLKLLKAAYEKAGKLAASDPSTWELVEGSIEAEVRRQAAEVFSTLRSSRAAEIHAHLVEGALHGADNASIMADAKRLVTLNSRYAKAIKAYERSLMNDSKSPVPKGKRKKMVKEYADRLLTNQAQTIARTEVQRSLNAGLDLTWREMYRIGMLDDSMERKWITHKDERLCETCAPMHGERAAIGGMFMTPLGPKAHPPLHPNCRCTTVLAERDISKANPKGWNQYTGPGPKSPEAAKKETHAKVGFFKGPFGRIKMIDPRKYEAAKGGISMDEVRRKGILDNDKSSFTRMINPSTGYRMSNTEIGDTMEHLIGKNFKGSPLEKVLGGGFKHHVGRSNEKGNKDRRGSIDISTSKYAFELKTIHLHGKEPNVSIKASEVVAKEKAAKKLGKQGAVLIALLDDRTMEVHFYAHLHGFRTRDKKTGKKNTTGKFTFRRNKKDGTIRPPQTVQYVATLKISKKDWEHAQFDAGWARGADGKRIDPDSVSKAMPTYNGFKKGEWEPSSRWIKKPELVIESQIANKRKQVEGSEEDTVKKSVAIAHGDTLIYLGDDGRMYIV